MAAVNGPVSSFGETLRLVSGSEVLPAADRAPQGEAFARRGTGLVTAAEREPGRERSWSWS